MDKHLQYIQGVMRSTAAQYELISAGDEICVGVSGGKDSVVLALALHRMAKYYPQPYHVHALTLDSGFLPQEVDYTPLAQLFEREGIPYHVKRTNIGHVVLNEREEANPCALCAKMRRGILHTEAKALGCNKIALGHHLDDAVETFYMNLWQGGRLACFSPKSYLSRKDITLIRPLALASESSIAAAANALGVPIISSGCPVDGHTARQDMKDYIALRRAEDPAFVQKTLTAMQSAHLSGW